MFPLNFPNFLRPLISFRLSALTIELKRARGVYVLETVVYTLVRLVFLVFTRIVYATKLLCSEYKVCIVSKKCPLLTGNGLHQVEEGDTITYLNIYHSFVKRKRSKQWCEEMFVRYKAMLRVEEIRAQVGLRVELGRWWDRVLECISLTRWDVK